MIYLCIAGVLFVFFINFIIITSILRKNANRFDETQRKGTAEVVGYDSSEQSRWYSLIVKVRELKDNKTYIVNSAKINIHDYPQGSVISVVYAKTEIFGKEMYQVYLPEKMPPSNQGMAKVFHWLSMILLFFTIGFGIAGVISFII